MARPSLATLGDLEDLLGEPVTGSSRRALHLLAHASEIVRAYAGVSWLNDDGDELADVPAQVPAVVAAMVVRATENPLGITQETAGPFSRSFGSDAAQRIYMTRQEKAIVRAAAGVAAVGTIGTTRGPLETRGVVGVGGMFDPAVAEFDPFSLT